MKVETDKEFRFAFPQEENPDWNYGRNKSFALKRTDSCWSSSLSSVERDGFVMPNRDYPQQGVVVKVSGKYTKFLDAPAFKLIHDKKTLKLEKEDVELTPWEATYTYRSGNTVLRVSYYLSKSTMKNKYGGWIKFDIDSELDDLRLVLCPLVDIRKIEEDSPPVDEYNVEAKDHILRVQRGGKDIIFGSSDETEVKPEEERWTYKLGLGYREKKNDIRFKEINRKPIRTGILTYRVSGKDSIKVGFACGKDIDKSDIQFFKGTDTQKDLEKARKMLDIFSFPNNDIERRFMKARLLSFFRFSVKEGGMEIPGAGEWWLKDVYFRDLFESIFHNMEVYRQVKGDEWLKKILTWARIYLEDGSMAIKVTEGEPSYNSTDALLLYLLCAAKFYEKTGDKNFKKSMRKTFESVVGSLNEYDDGLIRCRPDCSRIDSKIDGRSTRIPDNWDVEENGGFLLPEVNALWIRVLEKYNKIYGTGIDITKIWKSYKNTFWDGKKGFLYQIVYKEDGKNLEDRRESSVAVVSLALLKDHFFGYEIHKAWKVIEERLLVGRKPVFFDCGHMPFGILTKNSRENIYLDDDQRHEAVVWPRDCPYLFKILEKIGREKVKKQIIKNMLDHQMSEGAVFYNHGLFSLPEGENPHETSLSSNPIPVRNPIKLAPHFLSGDIEVKER